MSEGTVEAALREAVEALGKAALTFSDFGVGLQLLRHDTMAEAAAIAEAGCREAIEDALAALRSRGSSDTRLTEALLETLSYLDARMHTFTEPHAAAFRSLRTTIVAAVGDDPLPVVSHWCPADDEPDYEAAGSKDDCATCTARALAARADAPQERQT